MDKICRKLKRKYKFKFDINAILSDLIYARILEPSSKRSSFKTTSEFLESPSYELHDIYRALDVLGNECDMIQSDIYKNSHFLGSRNDKILYYDCTNYYFEIEQEDGSKKYGNANDPARFIGKTAVTKDGEAAQIKHYLDEDKIMEESMYDGLYAVCTDLLDDDVSGILKISEQRWQIEECFRIMKTDFTARPVYLQDENRIKAHFLICFLALMIYRFLEKKLGYKYTCKEILDTLKGMNFAKVQEQGFIPLYKRDSITDDLHEILGFQTDYQFITKSKMKTIQKNSKGRV